MSCQDRPPIPPEKLLETDDPALIKATLAQVDTVDVIMDYVAFENQHEARTGVLSMLQSRAAEIRD
jgi:hypothetical protein